MRIHTNKLEYADVRLALANARDAGVVADHVYLIKGDEYGSRSHARAFEVRLGTHTKVKGDKRTFLNTGNHGAASERNGYDGIYGATYDEWGWFLSQLYEMDPTVTAAGFYRNREHFHVRTRNAYTIRQATDAKEPTCSA